MLFPLQNHPSAREKFLRPVGSKRQSRATPAPEKIIFLTWEKNFLSEVAVSRAFSGKSVSRKIKKQTMSSYSLGKRVSSPDYSLGKCDKRRVYSLGKCDFSFFYMQISF